MDRGDPSGAIGFSGDDRSTRLAHARLQPHLQRQGGIGPPANPPYPARTAHEPGHFFLPPHDAHPLPAGSCISPSLLLVNPHAPSPPPPSRHRNPNPPPKYQPAGK